MMLVDVLNACSWKAPDDAGFASEVSRVRLAGSPFVTWTNGKAPDVPIDSI